MKLLGGFLIFFGGMLSLFGVAYGLFYCWLTFQNLPPQSSEVALRKEGYMSYILLFVVGAGTVAIGVKLWNLKRGKVA